tara:strand:- start:114 stop:521 length:408 start_codon:yes stop_codon:yes gene_type:complete
MAIPNGSGSEVLRNAAINQNNATTAQVDFGAATGTGSVRSTGNSAGVTAVPANVIITVINITCSVGGADQGNISATIDWQGGGTDILIFKQMNVLDNTTFIYNERMVLREGDILKLYNSANWCDWSVNFIYQDWT